MSPLIRVIGVGGCGAEAISRHITIPQIAGYGEVCYTVLDTSESNVTGSTDKYGFYHVPGVKGAGKDRQYAKEKFKPFQETFFNEHPPCPVNLVVCSTGGGTGSGIAPEIIRHLISRDDCITFVIAVADVIDSRQTYNSMEFMSELISISKDLKKPVNFKLFLNSNSKDHPDFMNSHESGSVNALVGQVAKMLALVCSEQHQFLDRRDLNNWVNYHKVTAAAPTLTEIKMYNDLEIMEDDFSDGNAKAISVVSLLVGPDETRPAINQLSDAYGVFSSQIVNSDAGKVENIYLATTTSYCRNILSYLKTAYDDAKKRESSVSESFDDFLL